MLSGMPEARDDMPMVGISSGRDPSRDPLNPDFTGKVVPTGLLPRPVELICRRPSPLRRAGNPPKDMPSPDGETPSDPALK
jgi:hypothetical protein